MRKFIGLVIAVAALAALSVPSVAAAQDPAAYTDTREQINRGYVHSGQRSPQEYCNEYREGSSGHDPKPDGTLMPFNCERPGGGSPGLRSSPSFYYGGGFMFGGGGGTPFYLMNDNGSIMVVGY